MEDEVLSRCVRYDPGTLWGCHNRGLKGGLAFLCLFRLGDPGSPHWFHAIAVSSPLLRIGAIFKGIEVGVSRGDLASDGSASLMWSIAVSIKMSREVTPMAHVLFLHLPPNLPHPFHFNGLAWAPPIHLLLGCPFVCVSLILPSPSDDSLCWAHLGCILPSDRGVDVAACQGKACLEGVMGPVRSLPQIDTLVDVGGGPSAHLSLSEASSRFLGFLGVGIAFNKVAGVLPIKEGPLSIQHPLVLLQELLLDGASLELMHIGDDAEVAKNFDRS